MSIKKDSYLTTKEAAAILGISRATVINWIKLGKLPGVRKGTSYSIPRADALKAKKALPSSSLLQSRRNKSLSEKNFIPGSYIDKHSPNYKIIKKLLSKIAEDNISVSVNDLIAYYALDMLSKCNIQKAYIKTLLAGIKGSAKRTAAFLSEYPLIYIEGEDTLGMLYISLRRLRDKKSKGAYYTPFFVVDKCLEAIQDAGKKCILDPACGTGNFLIRLPKSTVLSDIYGCDIDPLSVFIARINLALKYGISSDKELDIITGNIKITDFLNTDAFSGSGKNFDVVLGNPPWGYSYTPSETSKLQKKFSFLSPNQRPESFSLFIEKGISVLKKGGMLTYLLPETLLGSDIYRYVRSGILKSCTVGAISYLGEIFDKVQCPCIILKAEKKAITSKSADTTVSSRIEISFYKKTSGTLHGQKSFCCKAARIGEDSFHVLCDDSEHDLIKKIDACKHFTLKGNAEFALGIVTGGNKQLLSPIKKRGYEPIVKGSDINPYIVSKPTAYISYKPENFQQCADTYYYRAKERLLYRFISGKPIFAYEDTGLLSLNSANILIPKADGYSALYIMCVLNSPVIFYYYKNSFKNMKVLRSAIEALPIPVCDNSSMREISDMAKKKLAAGTTDFSDINKKIASLYKLSKKDYDHVLDYWQKNFR